MFSSVQKYCQRKSKMLQVNQSWRRWLKIIFVLEIGSFKLSESFKSVAQSVLEILEEVYLREGGGNRMFPPPPGWDRVKKTYQLNRRRGALPKDKVSGRRK